MTEEEARRSADPPPLSHYYGRWWCEVCKQELDEETIFVEDENKFLCKKCCEKKGHDYESLLNP